MVRPYRTGQCRAACYGILGAVDTPTIYCRENGSLRVDGVEVLRDARGNPIRTEGRGKGNFALCRCGASPIKPFCDGTHKTTGFRSARSAGGEWGAAAKRRDHGACAEEASTPVIEVTAHGPYVVTGRIELIDAEHGGRTAAARYALCRCGRSADKPFCDGSHREVGFADPGLDTTDPAGS